MPFTKIAGTEATDEQLRDYAPYALELPIDGRWGPARILAEIASVQGRTPEDVVILVADTASAPVQTGMNEFAAVLAKALGKTDEASITDDGNRLTSFGTVDEPTFTIRIARGEGEGGDRAITVCNNGNEAVMMRGVPIPDVPARFVYTLLDATGFRLEQGGPREGGGYHYVEVGYERFPLEILQRPSDAALEAWQERTRNVPMA
jgi:hypothetical protein